LSNTDRKDLLLLPLTIMSMALCDCELSAAKRAFPLGGNDGFSDLDSVPSGTLARSASTYATLDDAIREAGAQLKKGFAVDAWIEDENGVPAAGVTEIKAKCGIV